MNPSNPVSPLGEEHLTRINDALAKIDTAKAHVQLARAAQINVDAEAKELEAAEATLRRIKAVYFPNRV